MLCASCDKIRRANNELLRQSCHFGLHSVFIYFLSNGKLLQLLHAECRARYGVIVLLYVAHLNSDSIFTLKCIVVTAIVMYIYTLLPSYIRRATMMMTMAMAMTMAATSTMTTMTTIYVMNDNNDGSDAKVMNAL